MSQPGMGVMLHYLSGGSEHDPKEYYGKKIVSACLEDNKLELSFDDGKKIQLWDARQSCCESRYMTTDDDPSSLIDHTLLEICAEDIVETQEGGEWHEMVFLKIQTDGGFITVVTHNEHNGYYGGFGLTIAEQT